VATDDDLAQVEREVHDAIAAILGRHGRMVTKWILAVETLDGDGVRDIESMASPDYRAWDSIGMLGFLTARERGVLGASAAREYFDGDEDGPGGG